MPMLVKRMWVEEMNAETAANSQQEADEETPIIGHVTDDLSSLGLVSHDI